MIWLGAAGATTDPNQLPWWVTIVLAILTGLGSGLVGALIAARAQSKVARDGRRDVAQIALWSYHRVLHDWAGGMETQASGIRRFTKPDDEKLNAAREAAYPYRSYLSKDKQKLVARDWMPEWKVETGDMGVSDEFLEWADDLETELDRVFRKDER